MRDCESESLGSVRNACALLLLLGDQESVGVTEAAGYLGVARSTAHRLLSTLKVAGLVEQDQATRLYRTGTALAGLGLSATRRLDLRRRARPHIEMLSQELDETVNLIVLEGAFVRFVDCLEGTQALRVSERNGLRQPAHCNSVGKAILAAMPREALEAVLPPGSLQGLTPHSITSRRRLDIELERIRHCGYATNIEESEEHLSAVGAAIPGGGSSPPRAGIGVSMPASRVTPARIAVIGEATKRAAQLVAAG